MKVGRRRHGERKELKKEEINKGKKELRKESKEGKIKKTRDKKG